MDAVVKVILPYYPPRLQDHSNKHYQQEWDTSARKLAEDNWIIVSEYFSISNWWDISYLLLHDGIDRPYYLQPYTSLNQQVAPRSLKLRNNHFKKSLTGPQNSCVELKFNVWYVPNMGKPKRFFHCQSSCLPVYWKEHVPHIHAVQKYKGEIRVIPVHGIPHFWTTPCCNHGALAAVLCNETKAYPSAGHHRPKRKIIQNDYELLQVWAK